jgi:hypothetical protein
MYLRLSSSNTFIAIRPELSLEEQSFMDMRVVLSLLQVMIKHERSFSAIPLCLTWRCVWVSSDRKSVKSTTSWRSHSWSFGLARWMVRHLAAGHFEALVNPGEFFVGAELGDQAVLVFVLQMTLKHTSRESIGLMCLYSIPTRTQDCCESNSMGPSS